MQQFMKICRGFYPILLRYMVNMWEGGVCKIYSKTIKFNPKTILKATFLINQGKELKRNAKIYQGKKHIEFGSIGNP